MGAIHPHAQCAQFFGLILSESVDVASLHERLVQEFGPIHSATETWPFTYTEHYTPEMGPNLRRQFVAMDRAYDPSYLASMKQRANEFEDALAADGKRTVNLDPGLILLEKVVLASTKNHSHRVPLPDGIYGEVTLVYHRGRGYEPMPWTYPDYKDERVRAWLGEVRGLLKG